MAVLLNPYITFRGNARSALEFYHGIFGGNLELATFGDFSFHAANDPAEQEWIMHGTLRGADGLVLMAADIPTTMEYAAPAGISISLSGPDGDGLRRYWDGLSAGADIGEELAQAPWGASFGMLTDRFGVGWMVNIEPTG